jgi:tRNA(Ile)-lysidine synthase
MNLLSRVRQFVRKHDLMRADTRVVAAVSGGSDSVALAHVLRELAAASEVRLVGVAHFNHELRPSAGADERFAEDVATSLGCPFLADREDVGSRARRDGRSMEDAARAARYEFFDFARRHFSADAIALGHTRDDQAETFLLRLARGAGPRGLAAMYPRNGQIVRPLLDCRRQDLRLWLAERHIPFVEDESNADVSIPRNRVRAELLPLLATRFNPAIVDVLADEAELAREAWAWMDAMAADLEARSVRRATTASGAMVREIDVAGLQAAPLALQRAVLWRVMSEVAGRRPIAFGHVDAALRLTDQRGETRADFPGQRLERIGPSLVLTGRVAGAAGRRAPEDASNFFRFPLSIPGEVALPDAGWVVSAATMAGGADARQPNATVGNTTVGNSVGKDVALVRHDVCRGGLAVRNRRPGDRFRPVGLDGQKKLQDYFVDRKVARALRDRVPLVVDETDRIVWVAGFGIDEAFRVTDPAQAVVILTLKALGGSV